jgi:hypothetical protein
MKENDFFFFQKFGYVWGTYAEVSQEYEYPKSIRYEYDFIFGVPVLHSRLCTLPELSVDELKDKMWKSEPRVCVLIKNVKNWIWIAGRQF